MFLLQFDEHLHLSDALHVGDDGVMMLEKPGGSLGECGGLVVQFEDLFGIEGSASPVPQADDILAHPHCLIGSVDYICDELQRRRETYGISYIAVMDDGENNMVDAFAPVVARLAGK